MSRALELLTDACVGLPTRVQKMFGGHGFFAPNGGMFAGIVTDDEIIFKLADAEAKAALISEGGHPWTYAGKQKPMTMAEWIVVPDAFYDDPEALAAWAKRAHRLAPPKLKKAGKAAPKTKKPGVKKSKSKSTR